MDKERLKLIVRNLELLVDGLKAEVYSDVDAYTKKVEYDEVAKYLHDYDDCLLYTSPSPRDGLLSRMPSSA